MCLGNGNGNVTETELETEEMERKFETEDSLSYLFRTQVNESSLETGGFAQ